MSLKEQRDFICEQHRKDVKDFTDRPLRYIVIAFMLILMALFTAFIGGMMTSDYLRGNASQVGDRLEWQHGSDTVRLDVSKFR